jgi:hypothetical protein
MKETITNKSTTYSILINGMESGARDLNGYGVRGSDEYEFPMN